MANPENDETPSLPTGPFSGPLEFAERIRAALDCAAREKWKQMVWCDSNYDDWPLREKAVTESLHAWAGQGRKLILLARSFDAIERNQPRFVDWRIRWDHLIECRVVRPRGGAETLSVLWGPHWFLQRIDPENSRGVSSYEAQTRVSLQEELDELRKQGSPGFPASRLGL